MRYKAPGDDTSQLIEVPILPELGDETEDVRSASPSPASASCCGSRSSSATGTKDDAIALAEAGALDDPFGYFAPRRSA
ncbi:MAG: hypothetical protein R3D85_05685 [Paracoccaceae bacterium]